MVVEYIRYTLPDTARRTMFESAYAAAKVWLEASLHCLAYELTRCSEDESQYILRIEWDSVEGHLQGFRRSAEFQRFFASIRPFVAEIAEMRHYGLVRDIAWRRPGLA